MAALQQHRLRAKLQRPTARFPRSSGSVSRSTPSKWHASGIFGVTSDASGRSRSFNAWTASGAAAHRPSQSSLDRRPARTPYCSSLSAASVIISAENSMPVFTASAPMSASTASARAYASRALRIDAVHAQRVLCRQRCNYAGPIRV